MVRYDIGIVGGSGFVGSSLARHLSRSFKVKVLDKTHFPASVDGVADFQCCDVTDYDEVENGIRDVEIVIHTAVVQIPLINEIRRQGYEVNVLGTQNVCEAVDRAEATKGLLLTSSWHVFGERDFRAPVDEAFGFRPDKVEDRARIYALCKIAQEAVVRLYDEMSPKIYGIIRIGTVLGEAMSEKTAANIFISNALLGRPITPYRHSMHRLMIYIDVVDVCKAFEAYVKDILESPPDKKGGSFSHIVNVFWPKPISIIELANMVRGKIVKCTEGKISPRVDVIDTGDPILYKDTEEKTLTVDVSRADDLLGARTLTSPEKAIERIIKARLCKSPV